MMPQIKTVIAPAAFELIRDRIAIILKDEIDNQNILTYDPELLVNIYTERSNQFDLTDLSSINVCLSDGTYDNKNYAGSVNGTYAFDIDVYAHSKTNEELGGDVRAAIKLQKLLRLCRSILENPIYKTLGWSNPKINRVFVSDFNIAVPGTGSKILDTQNSMMARMKFNVVVNEIIDLINPALINGYETQVLIDDTGKGYYYYGD